MLLPHRRTVSWPRRVALLLPSLWVVLAILAPTGADDSAAAKALFLLAAAITVLGIPFLTWVLLRLAVDGYVQLPRRLRVAAIAVTVVVGVLAFGLGSIQHLYLTCGDFTISGNSAPPGCTPGGPSLR